MELTAGSLDARLDALAAKHGVPGVEAAVLQDGVVIEGAAGVLNTATGVRATPDSLFQIGSISKVYTATLVMSLVDEGLVHLDKPVKSYLADFAVADAEVSEQVTIRHLLTHTSGIDGDHFADTGRGDDCLERYVNGLGEVPLIHPLGATFSYCNTGFLVLGRLAEVVTDMTWDAAVRERLIEPLGLSSTVTLPEEVLRYRAAIGHSPAAGAPPLPVPVWGLPRFGGPAGLVCATAAEVLTFARLHLDGGVTASGDRVLDEATASAMVEPSIPVPDRLALGPLEWGLGWMVFDWDRRVLYGHDGATIGQRAFLRIVPDAGVAIVLLTNGGDAHGAYRELFGELLDDLAGVRLPPAPQPAEAAGSVDGSPHVGIYERESARIEVVATDDGLEVVHASSGPMATLFGESTERARLYPADSSGSVFVAHLEDSPDAWTPVTFFEVPDGGRYISIGFRSTPKVD